MAQRESGGMALLFLLISALVLCGWSRPRLGRFTLGQGICYALSMRMDGPQGRFEWMRKISPPSVFYPRTVQHVASRYSYYAVPARILCISTSLLHLSLSWRVFCFTYFVMLWGDNRSEGHCVLSAVFVPVLKSGAFSLILSLNFFLAIFLYH